MTKCSPRRILRRQVKRGMLEEIKRRTGRDASLSSEVRRMIEEKIWEKEREKIVEDAKPL